VHGGFKIKNNIGWGAPPCRREQLNMARRKTPEWCQWVNLIQFVPWRNHHFHSENAIIFGVPMFREQKTTPFKPMAFGMALKYRYNMSHQHPRVSMIHVQWPLIYSETKCRANIWYNYIYNIYIYYQRNVAYFLQYLLLSITFDGTNWQNIIGKAFRHTDFKFWNRSKSLMFLRWCSCSLPEFWGT
jgi:hypothetical protein